MHGLHVQWNPGRRPSQLRDHPVTTTKFPKSRMVSSLISLTDTQTATTGLEGPKLQIHLSNVTEGPNW
jgi:hypothetical protein